VRAAGICGSDLAEYDAGPIMTRPEPGSGRILPVVLGHEFAGEVVEIGPAVRDMKVGSPVVCGAGLSCGSCRPCRRGRTNLCRRYRTVGYDRHGGLAEYCAVPAETLLDASPYQLAMDTLALAQPMAIAAHCVARSGLRRGDLVVIVGVGGIGAFVTWAAVRAGAEVWVWDIAPDRLELNKRLGAHQCVDARSARPADALRDAGRQADVLFEVTGTTTGLRDVLDGASPGSTIVPVGVQKSELPIALGPLTLREISLIGSTAHVLATDLPRALEHLAARGDGWGDVAAEVRTLPELVDARLRPEPLGSSRPVKLLVDPAATESRPAGHRRRTALHAPSARA
jgi:threonine dehydrogenase-like Zn-dependent dehydrogenase